MPQYIIFLIIVVVIIVGLIWIKKRNREFALFKSGSRIFDILLFILSLFIFIVSLILFRNMGMYANDFGASTVDIAGGWIWLEMDTLRLVVSFIVCLISAIRMFGHTKK